MSHFMFCSHGWLQRSGWRYCDFGRYSSPWLLRIKSFYFHFGKPRIYLFNYYSFGHFTTKPLSVSDKFPNTKLVLCMYLCLNSKSNFTTISNRDIGKLARSSFISMILILFLLSTVLIKLPVYKAKV